MRKENSTNSINQRALQESCNAHKVLSQINGRWKISIIFALQEKKLKYSDFKLILSNITDRILTKQLKELNNDCIISNSKNKIHSIYYLTNKGEKILNLLKQLNATELE